MLRNVNQRFKKATFFSLTNASKHYDDLKLKRALNIPPSLLTKDIYFFGSESILKYINDGRYLWRVDFANNIVKYDDRYYADIIMLGDGYDLSKVASRAVN